MFFLLALDSKIDLEIDKSNLKVLYQIIYSFLLIFVGVTILLFIKLVKYKSSNKNLGDFFENKNIQIVFFTILSLINVGFIILLFTFKAKIIYKNLNKNDSLKNFNQSLNIKMQENNMVLLQNLSIDLSNEKIHYSVDNQIKIINFQDFFSFPNLNDNNPEIIYKSQNPDGLIYIIYKNNQKSIEFNKQKIFFENLKILNLNFMI